MDEVYEISIFCGIYLTNDTIVWFKNGNIYNMPEVMFFAIIWTYDGKILIAKLKMYEKVYRLFQSLLEGYQARKPQINPKP